MRARVALQLAALCTVPFIMVLGNSMLIPVLPGMREALHLTRAQSGLAITAFSIPAGFAITLAGYLSDRYGRKVVIVPALVAYALGGVISFLGAVGLGDKAFPVVLLGRVVQGIGAAGTAPVAMAMAGDIFQSSERARALGALEASNGLGKVLSPVLGSAIGLLSWYAVFLGYALLTVPAIAAVWLLTREPAVGRAQPALGSYLRRVWAVFRDKAGSLAAAFLAGTVALSILFGILFYLSETLEVKYGLDGIPKGGVLAIPVLAMSVTSYLTGNRLVWSQRLLKPAVVGGLGLGAAAMLLVPLLGGAQPARGVADWVFFAGMVVLGVGTGLVLPTLNTLVTSAVAEEERGMLTATYSAARFFGVALGPPVYGLLMGMGRAVPFYFSALVLGAAGLVALALLSPAELMGAAATGAWSPGRAGVRAGRPSPAGAAGAHTVGTGPASVQQRMVPAAGRWRPPPAAIERDPGPPPLPLVRGDTGSGQGPRPEAH